MKKENNHKSFRMIGILLFIAYLCMLCYFLFFADSMGRTYAERTYHYNLVPFREINRFWKYRALLDQGSVFLNLAGNVLAFIPLGSLLPILFIKCRKFFFTVILCFDFTLTVELIQLVLKVGCFDVDDMILNTLGGILGYLGYIAISYVWRKYNETKKK